MTLPARQHQGSAMCHLSRDRRLAEGTEGMPGGCCAPPEGEACRCLVLQERLGSLPVLLHSCTGPRYLVKHERIMRGAALI